MGTCKIRRTASSIEEKLKAEEDTCVARKKLVKRFRMLPKKSQEQKFVVFAVFWDKRCNNTEKVLPICLSYI